MSGGEIQLGPFRFNVDTSEIYDAEGKAFYLPPKESVVLRYLIANHDRVVSKNELAEECWKGETISDDAIQRPISRLRSIFRDTSKPPKFILTRKRKGFRWVGPVGRLPNQPDVRLNDGHRIDYLRAVWSSHSTLKLAYASNPSIDSTDLLSVYVSLKLGLQFGIQVRNGELVDWWLSAVPAAGSARLEPAGTAITTNRPKCLSNMVAPDAAILDRFLQELSRQISSEYPGGPLRDLDDGTYAVSKVECEAGPALFPYLVITGEPGSGKSTVLRHLALCLAGDALRQLGEEAPASVNTLRFWPLPTYIPVLVQLRSLVESAFPKLTSPVSLEGFFAHLRASQLQPFGLEEFLNSLRGEMRDGRVILLLDGLDEVPQGSRVERREQLKTLVRLLRTSFPSCRIVVTSRTYAYAHDWALDGFARLELQPLETDQPQQLARRLFAQTLGDAAADRELPAFRDRVQNLPNEIVSSPLLLTLLATLWANNLALPVPHRIPLTKGGIYRECVETVLRVWETKDADTTPILDTIRINREDLRRLLEALAFHVHGDTTAVAGFESGRIMTVARSLLLRDIAYDLLLDALAQRAGIIQEHAPNRFRFAHRTFEEYLAACFLLWESHYPDKVTDTLRRDPELWHNVASLLPEEIERRNLDPWALIRSLLKADAALEKRDPTSPGWYCIAHAARMVHKIAHADERHDIFRQRLSHDLAHLLAAGALSSSDRAEMGRVLSEFGDPRPGVGLRPDGIPDIDWVEIPTAGKTRKRSFEPFRLARYAVTHMQFQAFVDAPDGFVNDQWWRGLAQRPESVGSPQWAFANHPREKVSWYEAVAFCRWLSAKLGHEVRLPTSEEWEHAVHADGEQPSDYPYGKMFDADKGNTGETELGRTSAVGLFPNGRSAQGVLDLSGNVWEWTLTKRPTRPRDGVDANDPRGSDRRIVRGGSRSSTRIDARADAVHHRHPHSRNNDLGFRVACGGTLRIEATLTAARHRRSRSPFPIFPIHHLPEKTCTTNEVLYRCTDRLTTFAVSKDGQKVIVGGSSGGIRMLSISQLHPAEPIDIPRHQGSVRAARFHPYRFVVVSGGDDGLVRLNYPGQQVSIVGKHREAVYCVAVPPSGEIVASGSRDGTVSLWTLEALRPTPHVERTITRQVPPPAVQEYDFPGAVFGLDFDPVGSGLAMAGVDGMVTIRFADRKEARMLRGFDGTVFCVRFSPDGRRIAASGEDGSVRIWQLRDDHTEVFGEHADMVRCIAFHHSGRLIASASKDRTVRLWAPEINRVWVFEGHSDYVYCTEFTPAGNSILSCSGDGTLRLWPIPSEALALIEE